MIRNEPRITPELVAEHGLKPDEYERILELIGREPTLHRARHLLGDVERALLVQILKGASAQAADQGALGHPGARRKRRRHRHRRRARLRLQDGEPQPPLLSSSPIRAPRPASAAFCATFSRWARGPIACLNPLRFGAPKHPQDAASGGRRRRRDRRLWQLASACRRSAARYEFHTRYDGNILVNAMAVGIAEDDEIFYAKATRRRQQDRLSRLQDRPRRNPWRDHGIGRFRGRRGGKAPNGAGRRSVHRKALARSLSRD